jgi:hypothetical protein
MKGYDIQAIANILGYKDLKMSARYTHLSNQYLSDAAKGLDAVFGNLRPQGVPRLTYSNEGKSVSD